MRQGWRRIFIGLIGLSLSVGCASGPSWNRFSRRSKPSPASPVASLGAESDSPSDVSTQPPGSSDHASSVASKRSLPKNLKTLPETGDDLSISHNHTGLGEQEAGGQFDVSSRLPRSNFEPIEAPAPKRKTPATTDIDPAIHHIPFEANTEPASTRNVIEPSKVTTADFQSSDETSEILPVGGQDYESGWEQRESAVPQTEPPEPSSATTHAPINANLINSWPTITPGERRTPQGVSSTETTVRGSDTSQRIAEPDVWSGRTSPQRGVLIPPPSPNQGRLEMPEQWWRQPLPQQTPAMPTAAPAPGHWEPSTVVPVGPAPWPQTRMPAQPTAPATGIEPVSVNSAMTTPFDGSTAGTMPPNFNFNPNANFAESRSQSIPVAAPTSFSGGVPNVDLNRVISEFGLRVASIPLGTTEAERQAYLQNHVQLRLLQLLAGRTGEALQPIPEMDSADQEFWQQMMWGIANYFDAQGMPDSAERATQTVTQLRAATARLQEKARLELHNVAFCHKISGFGNYQRFKRDEFTPGQPVLLYAEVTNFKSEQTQDGQHRTVMKSLVEVLEGSARGRVVESIPFPPPEDRCRNQRRDYFHSYEFTIPQTCNPGPHTLRLTVEDQLGKKTTVATLNFTVQ